MRLVVVSHKPCWPCENSPAGFASNGGFPFQMRALSELFDSTTLVVPGIPRPERGEIPLTGSGLFVVPLTEPRGREWFRKLYFLPWTIRNAPRIFHEVRRADAVHVPIPGDVGTVGMLLAFVLRKPLFVRYCGNWLVQTTVAERFWKWFMERTAGGKRVMLATGGSPEPPSRRNPATKWIFSTTLTRKELQTVRMRRSDRPIDDARLIIACRQDGGKGSEVLIESMPLVLKRFPKATLAVVGDGSALENLKRRAERSGAANRISFHGAVDHDRLMQLFHDSDLFCYPTSTEGFPKVVLEALACGLPVVTTRVSVLPHLINGCGVLLDDVTPSTVADAICGILAEPTRYWAMSLRAIEQAQDYSLENWRDTIGSHLRAAWGPLQTHV